MNTSKLKSKIIETLDEMEHHINQLEKKGEELRKDARKEYEEIIAELQEKRDELKKKYDSLEDKTENKWEDAKVIIESATESFNEGFRELGKLFK